MSKPVLILFGSGPGIGLALAKAFASKQSFARIVLCARNASRLEDERRQVEMAAKVAKRTIDVATFRVDLSELAALPEKLKQLEDRFLGDEQGELSCVWHNAARVRFSEVLSPGMQEVEEDMKTNALSLYTIAQWSIPLLLKDISQLGHPKPSFIATNSHLPESPMPVVLSLSMAKAAQQNLIGCLNEAYGDKIHFGVVKVCGLVSEEHEVLNPTEIARTGVEFWEGGRAAGLQLVIS